jgi:hypothetical protein
MTDSTGVNSAAINQALQRVQAARQHGAEFLLNVIRDDGSVARTESRVTWYRLPWALAVCGEVVVGHRVLDWIERECFDDQRGFHGGILWNATANDRFNTYPETCLAYGAMLLRRLDLARRAMDAALCGFDPETGGVLMDRSRKGPNDGQLLFLTCQYGMSAALSGRRDEAIAVGSWLENLWNAQPELPDRLYTVWTRTGGLVTTIPEGKDARHYANDAQIERQYHYNGGIAAACLTHIGMLTGETKWFDLARQYEQFSIDSTSDQFNTRQVCKSAWGAGLLTLATGTRDYAAWLVMLANWFADLQEADGSWSNTPYLDPHPTNARRAEVTAEFVVHVDTLMASLSVLRA